MLSKNAVKTVLAALALSSAALSASTASAGHGDTLKAVKERGHLLCTSGNSNFLGFFEVGDNGEWKGLDIDYCRALATAIFGSEDNLKLVPISWAQRFPALQSGEIDVVIKATGWTMSRDTELAIQFSRPYFLGVTGFAVNKDLGVETAAELEGGSICVASGTSTERLTANYLESNNIDAELITYEKIDETYAAYYAGRCDAVSEWGPSLAATLSQSENPDAHVILPDAIAVEPEAAAMRQGDDQWVDVVNWLYSVTLVAEEYGITSANVDEFKANPPDTTVSTLLGVTPGIGDRLGLSNDWAYNVIKAYGNAAEIYHRNIGENSPYKLPRGKNALWKDGGVLYPMVLD
ncbi:amino acid ABC transporter substrate-binding protein [Kiloniella sp. b19]|uniref:amino acid ABC transporter substrate-binding protein n=1 Tax=Kiloniella sp. GXU_MW_B19 TaxID=3141326 RepID=UPI0031DD7389